jgi:predicted transcriptional regulator
MTQGEIIELLKQHYPSYYTATQIKTILDDGTSSGKKIGKQLNILIRYGLVEREVLDTHKHRYFYRFKKIDAPPNNEWLVNPIYKEYVKKR